MCIAPTATGITPADNACRRIKSAKKSLKMTKFPQKMQKLASHLLRDGVCARMRASTDYPKMTEKQPATHAPRGRLAV